MAEKVHSSEIISPAPSKKFYDCRMLFNSPEPIPLGCKRVVPIKFLSPTTVALLKAGDTFKIWTGKFIGWGTVKETFG